jgi:hypothetical protein
MIGIRATNPHNLVCRRNEPSAIEVFRVGRQREDTGTGQDPHKSANVHIAAILYFRQRRSPFASFVSDSVTAHGACREGGRAGSEG